MFEQIPDITAQRAQLTPDAIAFRDLVRGSRSAISSGAARGHMRNSKRARNARPA
jgi:hypothetical protein